MSLLLRLVSRRCVAVRELTPLGVIADIVFATAALSGLING